MYSNYLCFMEAGLITFYAIFALYFVNFELHYNA